MSTFQALKPETKNPRNPWTIKGSRVCLLSLREVMKLTRVELND